MYCRNCGKEVKANQSVCLNCGVKVGTGNSYCANCGNSVAANAAVCLNCGVSLAQKGQGKEVENKMMVAIVCLFLGTLGIHNFMMGEMKKGILKIVLTMACGLSFLLALVDLVKILTDKYEINPEKWI